MAEEAHARIRSLERQVKILTGLLVLGVVAVMFLWYQAWDSGREAKRALAKLSEREAEVAMWAEIEQEFARQRAQEPPKDLMEGIPPDHVSEEAKQVLRDAKVIAIVDYEDLGPVFRPVLKEILWVAPGTIFDYVVGEELGHRMEKNPAPSSFRGDAAEGADSDADKPFVLKTELMIPDDPFARRLLRMSINYNRGGALVICDGKPGEPAEPQSTLMFYGDGIPGLDMKLKRFRELAAEWKKEQEQEQGPGKPAP